MPLARLRPARDLDADPLAALIGGVYAEYPGCVLDLPGVDADLQAPATAAARRAGRWWVLEGDGDGRVVATVGAGALEADGSLELTRLYVAASHRRRGLGRGLVDRVLRHAAGLGATSVTLWSDTRFLDAHRLYTATGFTPTGRTRDLHDPSNTTEYAFARPVDPAPPTPPGAGPQLDAGRPLAVFDLPDGWRLRARLDGSAAGGDPDGPAVDLEVDGRWRARVVTVRRAGGSRRLHTDAQGRWWLDGARREDLDGVLDVEVEVAGAAPFAGVAARRRRAEREDPPAGAVDRARLRLGAHDLEVTRAPAGADPPVEG